VAEAAGQLGGRIHGVDRQAVGHPSAATTWPPSDVGIWPNVWPARAEGADLGDEVIDEIVDMLAQSPPDITTSMLTDREAGNRWNGTSATASSCARRAAHGLATPISEVVVPLLAAASDGPG
jgi:hypothetical protein